MKAALVVCGRIGSGKSTVSALLALDLSVQVVSFGEYVRHMARRDNQPTTRRVLQDLGDGLYQQMGASELVEATLELAGVGSDETVVIDGVRHIEVLTEIRRRADKTVAIYLDVSSEVRYQRRKLQGQTELSWDDFVGIDKHLVEAEIGLLKDQCDFVIDASQPLEHVRSEMAGVWSVIN